MPCTLHGGMEEESALAEGTQQPPEAVCCGGSEGGGMGGAYLCVCVCVCRDHHIPVHLFCGVPPVFEQESMCLCTEITFVRF